MSAAARPCCDTSFAEIMRRWCWVYGIQGRKWWPVLLLHVGIVVLLVGTRTGELDAAFLGPVGEVVEQVVIQELAAVVAVETQKGKRQSRLQTLGAHVLRMPPDPLQHLSLCIPVPRLAAPPPLGATQAPIEQLDRMLPAVSTHLAKLIEGSSSCALGHLADIGLEFAPGTLFDSILTLSYLLVLRCHLF